MKKSKAETKVDEVFLVSPKKDQDPDFKSSIIIPSFPKKSVCMTPIEYKRIRATDVVCTQIIESTPPENEKKWKDYLGIFVVGFLGGYVTRDLSNK